MIVHWTHLARVPGPHPDRCIVNVTGLFLAIEGEDPVECGCDAPANRSDGIDPTVCVGCGHELVPLGSRPPSDSPEPPR
jgi:hypothetical protein